MQLDTYRLPIGDYTESLPWFMHHYTGVVQAYTGVAFFKNVPCTKWPPEVAGDTTENNILHVNYRFILEEKLRIQFRLLAGRYLDSNLGNLDG